MKPNNSERWEIGQVAGYTSGDDNVSRRLEEIVAETLKTMVYQSLVLGLPETQLQQAIEWGLASGIGEFYDQKRKAEEGH
jgi:hypothetical protein